MMTVKIDLYNISFVIFQAPIIPSQNLRQLMPATNLPQARVTKEKNKLVIVQHNKKH